MPEEDWPGSQAQRAVIIGDFDHGSAFGDRRQARLLAAKCFCLHASLGVCSRAVHALVRALCRFLEALQGLAELMVHMHTSYAVLHGLLGNLCKWLPIPLPVLLGI